MDVAAERTGMYLPRVLEKNQRLTVFANIFKLLHVKKSAYV